jgi:regulator of protease activity HflC (stomatin/prohibitin superfamily)
MLFARTLVLALEAYLGFGLLFALVFVWRGVACVDPSARSGTIGFRILILPGCAALWPWLLVRLVRTRKDASA